jgi:glucose-1-phosphate adenylyltransferase
MVMPGSAAAAKLSPNTNRVLSVIMGGGAGTRLFPLTKERAKPAVPLAGKYRIVDIPISNCINSELRRIYLLTQFLSASLHRHVAQAYKFDNFSQGFVEILAAEQSYSDTSWYQGTADAVRKNLVHILNHDCDYVLILSGDQLYRMDFREVIAQHIANDAELTIATIPVSRREASGLGIMQIDSARRITRFVEKPKDPDVQSSLAIPRDMYGELGLAAAADELLLASMGIYVFNRDVLIRLLDNSQTDFGKHIIPAAIGTHRVHSYVFQGYWEDIGTIRAFFEANLDITAELPRFNFFDMTSPIFTHPRWLPASKINGAQVDHAVISEGCIISHADIHQSVVGIRSIISPGAKLTRTIVIGSDEYESAESIAESESAGRPRVGIGANTRIANAIIDKNARIGNNVVITPDGKPENVDHEMYYIRDGIVIIPKNGVVPDGTVI